MSKFTGDYKGIGELLRAEFLQREMVRRAEKVQAHAEAHAPDAPPIGVGYKYAFRLMWGVKTSKKGTRRAFARVVNDSPHALYVEYGGGNTPAHRVLGKALDAAKD